MERTIPMKLHGYGWDYIAISQKDGGYGFKFCTDVMNQVFKVENAEYIDLVITDKKPADMSCVYEVEYRPQNTSPLHFYGGEGRNHRPYLLMCTRNRLEARFPAGIYYVWVMK